MNNCNKFLAVDARLKGGCICHLERSCPTAPQRTLKGPDRYTPQPTINECLLPHSPPAEYACKRWDFCPSSGCGFNCISFTLSDAEHLFTYVRVICVSFPVSCLIAYFFHFSTRLLLLFPYQFLSRVCACLVTPFVIQRESASVWC